MPMYRLYNKDLLFRGQAEFDRYVDAVEYFKPLETDRIFCVEEDNHEIECGEAWISELLDNPANREDIEDI